MRNAWKVGLLLAVLAVYAAAGFSAIHLEGIPRYLRNGATTSAGGGGGLGFPTPGLARTPGPPSWLAEAVRRSSIEVDLEVRSFRLAQAGPARILTLSKSTSLRDLTLGQDGPDLVIRLRTPATSLNGEPAYVLPGALGDLGLHSIRVSVSGNVFQAVLDGTIAKSATLPERPLSNWDTGYSLILGNEVGGQRPWLGEIRKATVRVEGRVFDVVQAGALEIPGRFWMMGPAPRYSGPAGGESRAGSGSRFLGRGLRDWTENFAGFVPLGALLVFLWPRSFLLRAVLFCALLSAAIEGGQLLLPGRDPQWSDLLLNTLGGLLGAVAGHVLSRWARRFRLSSPS